MRSIQGAIQEGAAAYLNRQYTVIAVIGIVVAILLAIFIQGETKGDPGHVLDCRPVPHRSGLLGRRRLRRNERGCSRQCPRRSSGDRRSEPGHAAGL